MSGFAESGCQFRQESKKWLPCKFDAKQWFLQSLPHFSVPYIPYYLSSPAWNNFRIVYHGLLLKF